MGKTIFDLTLKQTADEIILIPALANALAVSAADIGMLETESSEKKVFVQIDHRSTGYLTHLSVYADAQLIGPLPEWKLAARLAKALHDEVIIATPDDWKMANPYLWLRNSPNGQWSLVSEQPAVSNEEGFRFDETRTRQLGVSEEGCPLKDRDQPC